MKRHKGLIESHVIQKSSCRATFNWRTSCWATTLVVGPQGNADKTFFWAIVDKDKFLGLGGC
jgi:hypothetical protein